MSERRPLVYIAGPITAYGASVHDAARIMQQNVNRAMEVAWEVTQLGFFCFIPHLAYYFHIRASEDLGDLYYAWDNEILRRCDAVFKFAPSPGADSEEALAKSLGIPVAYSLEELKQLKVGLEQGKRVRPG